MKKTSGWSGGQYCFFIFWAGLSQILCNNLESKFGEDVNNLLSVVMILLVYIVTLLFKIVDVLTVNAAVNTNEAVHEASHNG